MQKSLKDEIKYLEKLITENPNSALFARLADCYLQMGRLDEAIEICERGVRLHPNYVTGHFVLGKCYFRKKLFDLAEKELKRVIVLDPKFIAAYRELGELAAQNGWQSACEANFNEILRLDPLNERAKQRLAMLRKQFDLSDQLKPPREEQSFQPEKGDKSLLTDSILAEEDESLFDLEELEAQQPDKTEKDQFQTLQPPIAEPDLNEEKELGLLEDIFKDTDITDLDAETAISSEQSPEMEQTEQKAENVSEGEAFDFPTTPEPLTREPDVQSEQNVVQPIHETPISEEVPSDPFEQYDPFYELQKEREKEQNGIDESLFPFEGEEEKIEPQKPVPEPKPFETETRTPIASPEEKEKPQPESGAKPSSTKESLATPTLGEIYAAQRQYAKAIGVYELLLKKDPANEMYKEKIEQLRKKMEEEADK